MSGIHFDLDLNITYSGVIGLATLPASVPRLMAARGNRLLQLQSAEEDAAVLPCGQGHHECLLDWQGRRWDHSQLWWRCQNSSAEVFLLSQLYSEIECWLLVGVQTAPVSGGHLELDMSINNVNQIYWYLTQVSIIYICQAVVELVVTRLQLTRRVLGRQKQTRRGRWRSWGLSVCWRRGGWRRGWSCGAPALIPAPGSRCSPSPLPCQPEQCCCC